jgi:hypothetical protein
MDIFFKLLFNERISPMIVLALFHLNETWVNWFYSRWYKHIGFFSLSDRVEKSNDLLNDFIVKVDGIKDMKEINIIMRGQSFDDNKSDIDYSHPTFCVNIYSKVNEEGVTYITSDSEIYYKMDGLDLHPLILIGDNKNSGKENKGLLKSPYLSKSVRLNVLHKRGPRPIGSGLETIICLSTVADKVNVYGFDSYFDNYLEEKTYFECLVSIYKTPGVGYRRLNLIAERLINLYYLNIMSKDTKFNVQSFLSNVDSQSKLFKKINNMICIS